MAVAILLLGVGLFGGASAREDLRVTVKQGVLEGVEKVNRVNKQPFYAFLSIPYAAPPLVEGRFKDPEDPNHFGEIFNATIEGEGCMSHSLISPEPNGDEDCLKLNVYTSKKPKDVKGSLRPVMFWIHGGGFFYDSGEFSHFGPDFLVRFDVILVTINFRMGVFGFLSVQNDKVPGNAGLKDQVKALQWVKENIEAFGGDPNCVTIFGMNSGGASVQYLMLSPIARGLFHRAISQSGVAINPWASIENNKETAFKLGDYFDCRTNNSYELVYCLQHVVAKDLAVYQFNILPLKSAEILVKDLNLPCIEPKGTKNAFLTEPPIKLLEAGNFTDVPFMLGVTRMETLLMEALYHEEVPSSLRNLAEREINKKPHLLLPRNLDFGNMNTKKLAGKKLKEFYFKNESLSNETIENLINLTSDSWYLYGVHKAALLHAKKGKSPVFLYHLTYNTKLPEFTDMLTASRPGPSNEAEKKLLFYLWQEEIEIPPEEMEVLDKIQKLWVNFAKYGNPTPDKSSSEVIWEPFTPGKESYLDIGKNFTAKTHLEKERMEFWTKLVSETHAVIF